MAHIGGGGGSGPGVTVAMSILFPSRAVNSSS